MLTDAQMFDLEFSLLQARDAVLRTRIIRTDQEEKNRQLEYVAKNLRVAADMLGFELVRSESIDMGR